MERAVTRQVTQNGGVVEVLDRQGKPTGERLPFKLFGGHNFEPHFFEPRFAAAFHDTSRPKRSPKVGEVLVFRRQVCGKGRKEFSRITQWGFAQSYDRVLSDMVRRPCYRVLKVATDSNNLTGPITTEWEGPDPVLLSAQRPLVKKGDRVLHDTLATTIEGGVTWSYQFQARQPNQSWRLIDDPRRPFCCLPQAVVDEFAPPGVHQVHCVHS